jgi:hypothetical protein
MKPTLLPANTQTDNRRAVSVPIPVEGYGRTDTSIVNAPVHKDRDFLLRRHQNAFWGRWEIRPVSCLSARQASIDHCGGLPGGLRSSLNRCKSVVDRLRFAEVVVQLVLD